MKHLFKKRGVQGFTKDTLPDGRVPVFVNKKLPLSELTDNDLIPRKVGGKRTDVIETGDVVAYTDRNEHPIAIGGMNIGIHDYIYSGTCGIVVKYPVYNDRVMLGPLLSSFIPLLEHFGALIQWRTGLLTNAHVANKNVLNPKTYALVQPSGTQRIIGNSIYTYPMKKAGYNIIDATIGDYPGKYVGGTLAVNKVLGIKEPTKAATVCKYGITTEYTEGTLLFRDATLSITYPQHELRFEGVDVYSDMSMPGDSGSVIIDKSDGFAVGLLFAGSDKYTFAVPMTKVASKIGFRLVDAI